MREYAQVKTQFGPEYFSFDQLLVVSPQKGTKCSWQAVSKQVIDWMNELVVQEVHKRNQNRVLRAIPSPPRYPS